MVCYAVPLIATVLLLAGRKATGWQAANGFWLNIMMMGGAVFGLIDHFWHGEIFLISAGWMTDLALGGFITAGITACWGFVVLSSRLSQSSQISGRIGILKKDTHV